MVADRCKTIHLLKTFDLVIILLTSILYTMRNSKRNINKLSVRVACAQINCTVGDIEGNASKILNYISKAQDSGVDVISFPELAITGYPPEDLLLKQSFINDSIKKLSCIARKIDNIVAIIGFVDRGKNFLFNAAALINRKKIRAIYHKMLLPNYGVFDEARYFTPGKENPVFRLLTDKGGCIFGLSICEDIWHNNGPTAKQAKSGASIIFNINASPYHMEKIKERERVAINMAKKNNLFIIYTNLVGGQDELVFDGQSFIVSPDGKIISRAEAFKEQILIADIEVQAKKFKNTVDFLLRNQTKKNIPQVISKHLPPEVEVYKALLLGLADYVEKNNFKKVVIGLSGGIDSAVVATLAVDALGKERVVGVFMPGRYSSKESETDAKKLAENLGIQFLVIPIDEIFAAYLNTLDTHFKNMPVDITEENLQARIRGNILMALSNKFGYLVLTTGNKSEMSTGYATLYGDMAGGFAVIKDVPKTLVYKLAKYRNTIGNVIPESIITKEPSAELKPDQKDSDTLPQYDTLDKILKMYVEQDKSIDTIIKIGFDEQTVKKIAKMVDRSEYKRRQAPPGIKITPRAFGKDRRMPITNKYQI